MSRTGRHEAMTWLLCFTIQQGHQISTRLWQDRAYYYLTIFTMVVDNIYHGRTTNFVAHTKKSGFVCK